MQTNITRPRIASSMLWLVLVGAALLVACADEDQGPQGNPSDIACCDCACGNGDQICLNVVADRDDGQTCNDVCITECAADTSGCTTVVSAEVCESSRPDVCPLSAAGDTDVPDPTCR